MAYVACKEPNSLPDHQKVQYNVHSKVRRLPPPAITRVTRAACTTCHVPASRIQHVGANKARQQTTPTRALTDSNTDVNPRPHHHVT